MAQEKTFTPRDENPGVVMRDKHGMPELDAKDREVVLTYLETAYPQRVQERGGWQNPFVTR